MIRHVRKQRAPHRFGCFGFYFGVVASVLDLEHLCELVEQMERRALSGRDDADAPLSTRVDVEQ